MIELKRAFKSVEDEVNYRVQLKHELRQSGIYNFKDTELTTWLEIMVYRQRQKNREVATK